MITRAASFKTSNDKVFETLADAQQEEIAVILSGDGNPGETLRTFCQKMVQNADKIVDVLSTTPTSKPRARRVNGGTKKRKPDAAAVNRELQDGKQ